jgi:hypothetical protein
MESSNYINIEMIAHEAYIRRAARVNFPFLLKGSYVTRQYFPPNIPRTPADLDWVYMHYLEEKADAAKIFSAWVTAVTAIDLNDNVRFRSFEENDFWRMIDYAMAEDFPTVNTDILCWVNDQKVEFTLDISFNLDIEQGPVPLLYRPLQGDPFTVPNTAPLSLQIAWKIHQTLVRPRFKDLFDLTYLVRNVDFNAQILSASLQALVNECAADGIDLKRLVYFLSYQFDKLFPANLIEDSWNNWRHGVPSKNFVEISYWDEAAKHTTDINMLPIDLTTFLTQLTNSLTNAGLTIALIDYLPVAQNAKRHAYKDLPNSYLSWNSDLKPIDESNEQIKDDR